MLSCYPAAVKWYATVVAHVPLCDILIDAWELYLQKGSRYHMRNTSGDD